jgi:hypothetical protein
MTLETTKRFFENNPALVISIAYFYASAIRAITEVVLLSSFGIPTLYFNSSGDILFFALRDWSSLIFGVLPLGFILLGDRIITDLNRGKATIAQGYLFASTLFLTIVLVPSFVIYNASLVAQSVKNNRRPDTDIIVMYADEASNQKVSEQAQLIDANDSYVFLWNYNQKKARVVSARRILSIEPAKAP